MHLPRYDREANALIFHPSIGGAADPLSAERCAFVCGSLQDPEKMRQVIGRDACFAPAIAYGFGWEIVDVDGRPVQFMTPTPDEPQRALPGIVWLELDAAEAAALDAFELADGRRRKIRLAVTVGRRRIEASTFVRQ